MAMTKQPLAKSVTRREFERLARHVEDCTRTLDLQFTRIAQLQAELDHIRAAWAKGQTKSRQ
jgi:hypothetical protein